MPTPVSSVPSGNCPLFFSSTLHFVTRAAIDKTFAIGPIVAARRGIAVEANHHRLRTLSASLGSMQLWYAY